MNYAIDCSRQGLKATGVVEDVMEWADTLDGRRRPTDVPARSESGLPLWSVEVLYSTESFGRPATVVARVTVPAAVAPKPNPMSAVSFVGLSVDVSPRRNGGIRESWRADGIESGVSAPKAGAS